MAAHESLRGTVVAALVVCAFPSGCSANRLDAHRFEELRASRSLAHAGHHTSLDPGTHVPVGPIRLDGTRVIGSGWSFDHRAGWEVTGDVAWRNGGMRAPDGFFVYGALEREQDGATYASTTLGLLRWVGFVWDSHEITMGALAGLQIETHFDDGTHAIQRIATEAGVGFVVGCAGTLELVEAHRAECLEVLASARVGVEEGYGSR